MTPRSVSRGRTLRLLTSTFSAFLIPSLPSSCRLRFPRFALVTSLRADLPFDSPPCVSLHQYYSSPLPCLSFIFYSCALPPRYLVSLPPPRLIFPSSYIRFLAFRLPTSVPQCFISVGLASIESVPHVSPLGLHSHASSYIFSPLLISSSLSHMSRFQYLAFLNFQRLILSVLASRYMSQIPMTRLPISRVSMFRPYVLAPHDSSPYVSAPFALGLHVSFSCASSSYASGLYVFNPYISTLHVSSSCHGSPHLTSLCLASL